jgi:hypothetical protein
MSTAEQGRIRSNVKRGYDWVTEHGAKYDILLDRVDVNTLSINTMDHCVLAQGSGRNFEDILYTLYLANAHEKVSTWCEDHGFVGVGDGEYTEECWRRLLELDSDIE